MKKVLSFDIGGTNTRLALINEDFEIEKQLIYPTVRDSKEAFLESIKKIILDLDINLDEVSYIGAGVPGVVDKDKGYIIDLPNVHIKDIPLGEYLYKEFGKKLAIRNDAEVACLAEAVLGAGKKYNSCFFITISTGLGGALCVDKENQDYVTEIGHTMFRFHDGYYEYEELASGTGIVKLCNLCGFKIKKASEFFEAVKNNEHDALMIYKEWLSVLSDFLEMVQNSYDPEVICVTGGVMKAKDIFFEDLATLNPYCNLVECHFSEGAGIMGSAVYAFKFVK